MDRDIFIGVSIDTPFIHEEIIINPEFESINIVDLDDSHYNPLKDDKFMQFCNKYRVHPFDPRWTDMYLRLCAEGLL